MRKLNLGFNFTQEHFEVLMYLLEHCKRSYTRIASIYGSPGSLNPFGSVREGYRESTPTFEEMADWLIRIKDEGVKVNITLNSLTPYHPELHVTMSIDKMEDALQIFLDKWKILVDCWIVAHPGIIDIVHKVAPHAKVIVSTIMNVHTLPQLHWIKKNWPQVVSVCPAIEKNRNFAWLKQANAILPLELLANEFCSMGGVTCEGLYRQACYMTQSLDLDGWCARDKCMEQRKNDPTAWLKSYFILPQWLEKYEQVTGIEHFKITGRTHGFKYFKFITETYLNEYFDGNLLALWGQLEATMPDADQIKEQADAEKCLSIPTSLLNNFNFENCSPDNCGIICIQCDKLCEEYNGKQRC